MKLTGKGKEDDLVPGRIESLSKALRSSSLTLPATFFGVLFVYILSAPSDLSWSYFGGDGGELITASYTLGIPHPPGYPTYVLLGKLFGFLPLGTLAGRYHLLSAISMSVAAVFVAKITLDRKADLEKESRSLSRQFLSPAFAAGLIFAFGPLVWSQAVIAEVYAINLAILAGLIWVLLSERRPMLAGVLFGLSLTTHLTSVLMFPLCMILTPRRNWGRFFLGGLVGLLPFFFLPFFAKSASPIIWGQPDNLKDWLWLISGRLYQPNILALAPEKWAHRIVSWLFLLSAQFLVLAIALYRLRYGRNRRPNQRFILALLLTALIYGIYAFGYATPDAVVLLLPGLLLVGVVTGLGTVNLGRSSLLLALLLLIIGSMYLIREKNPPIRPKFEQALAQIPEGAIVITPGDQTIAATWYFAYAEGQRPDIIVIDDNLFQFSWYRRQLSERYPKLQNLAEDNLHVFIQGNSLQYAVCWLSQVQDDHISCRLEKA